MFDNLNFDEMSVVHGYRFVPDPEFQSCMYMPPEENTVQISKLHSTSTEEIIFAMQSQACRYISMCL
jgi:hypothetical protein